MQLRRYFISLTFFCVLLNSAWAAEDSTTEDNAKDEQEKPFKLVDAGPGFGPFWLTENSLGFAYMEYDVRKTYPVNNLVFTKIRYDAQLGSINDMVSIPVGNSIMETSAHFVYDSRFRQIGYMISNANDRFGSAHGLQVGVLHLELEKPRIYLESPYYLNSGYQLINGVSLSFDSRGFIAAYSGDLYYIPFADAGARDTPKVNDLYSKSYLPYFDDSTVGAELLREGKDSKYPVYFNKDEVLLYESNDIILYNIHSKTFTVIATVGEDVSGLVVNQRTKQIAVLKKGDIIYYDIAGNELNRLKTGVLNARNLAWSPDGGHFAFDNIETVFIIELEPQEESSILASGPTTRSASRMPSMSTSCGSADRIMQIRRSLEAELNSLRDDVDQTRLIGLRRVSAQLRQLANCQSTITRGPVAPIPSQQTLEESLPAIDTTLAPDSAASTQGIDSESTQSNETSLTGKFEIIENDPASKDSEPEEKASEGFKVKKKKYNKFRDSPDML